MNSGREDHGHDGGPSLTGEAPERALIPSDQSQLLRHRARDRVPAAERRGSENRHRSQAHDDDGAVDEVRVRGAPQPPERGVTHEDDHRAGRRDGNADPGDEAQKPGGHIDLDDIHDQILGLNTQAGEGLSAPRAEPSGEGLPHGLQAETAVGNREPEPDDR